MRIKLLFCSIVCVLFISCQQESKSSFQTVQGNAFGTTFSVQYIAEETFDFSTSYDSIVQVINTSMSTYIPNSDISRINIGDTTVVVDDHFKTVFETSRAIHKATAGVFDPTIGILVNAWDFGPKGKLKQLDSLRIDSLLQTVGFAKVTLKGDRIHKEYPNTFIDFNALAKGYAVDVFAAFLETKGIVNYLVEIGGEIRGKGKNTLKNKPWRIGVEDPNFDENQSYSKVVHLKDEAMATSGSYRKYKIDTAGHRYAHIIDPKTGYPHRSNLLSVSVLASTCMEADAYATAFMAMGVVKSVAFLKQHPELKAYFIYESGRDTLQTQAVNGFEAASLEEQ